MAGTREDAKGLAGKEVSELESNIGRGFEALERAKNRGVFDIELGAKRDIEDITTGSRRLATGATMARDFGVEGANRSFEAKKKLLERQREKEKQFNPSYAYLGL